MRTTSRPGTATTAIYTRISKDRTAERKGVDRQSEDCHALCKRKGWAVAGAYEDNEISASKYTRRRRPAYRSLIEAIEQGRVNRIVVWKLDRLYRHPKELEALIDLAEHGMVEIATVRDGELNLNINAGRTQARIAVAMAAGSSDDTSDRIIRQKQQRRAAGLPPGGIVPFGWRTKTVIDPAQSKILVAAMDAVLKGRSLSDVAREWNAKKVRGRAGWDANIVGRILTRPHHAGLLVHKGQVLPQHGTWKPLINREKYERLVSVVAGRAAMNSHAPRRTSMLTGIVKCGVCGHTMYRSSSEGHALLRCHTNGSRGEGCGAVSVRAALVEPLVVEATMQAVDTLDLTKLVSKTRTHEQGRIAQDLAALDQREAEMGALFAAGKVRAVTVEAFTTKAEADRTRWTSQLARDVKRDALATFAGKPGALRTAWSLLSTDQRRTIITEALGAVTIMPVTHRGQRFEEDRVVIGNPTRKRRVR